MTNKFIVLCTLILAFHISGCTSNQSQDENQTVENADVDKIEAEDSSALAAAPTGEVAADDPSLQAALGEGTSTSPTPDMAATEMVTPDVVPNDAIANEVAAAPTLDESSLNNPSAAGTIDMAAPAPDLAASNITETPITDVNAAPPAADVSALDPTALTETPVIENSGTNTAMTESTPVSYDAPPVKKAGGELRKISAVTPFKTDAGWVNAVYVARPGEKLKDISQKIYSADKTKELKKIAGNGYLKSRSVKPGDKIYYVSPNRPDDSTKTLFYYEDMGMVPETYVAKKGDTLKKVAKDLLGYRDGSVELWSANPIESKSKLAEGDTLKYWRSATGVTSTIAANDTHGSAQLIDQSQMPGAGQTTSLPPPPTVDPAASMPLPPPPPDSPQMADANMPPMPADASANLPPPPPPPPNDLAPPPPPVDDMAAAPAKKKKGADEEATAETTGIGGLDSDTMMSLGAVGVLTAALAFVLIRRKKKKAENAAMMNDSHLG